MKKKWTSGDYAYAMDSDVISHGYETDLETEEHQNYDISGVSLSLYTEKNPHKNCSNAVNSM